ncbi:organic solute transporter subunit alpha [Lingula anatina]|uniref:Organic solute transporter subunit alpha n=1 Tax=Lingula anatina TaxID=7574 RepID=A0A1S3IBC5_LINAN|nr:organic solute transporter subunit alpha [Lingula anatina]|eukprot:XP_013395565.1 organic solute transporter subunit alpha [Lingula anatina]
MLVEVHTPYYNMESSTTISFLKSNISNFDNTDAMINKTDVLDCMDHIPHVWELFQEIPTFAIILLVACSIVCLITGIMAVLDLVFLYKRIQNSKLRTRILIIRALYGITSVTSLSGAMAPRANTLVDLVASCYLALCLFNFLHVIVDYHGGQVQLIEAFAGKPVPLRSPPCCCCCFCLPTIELDRHKFNCIKWLVRQVIIVCPMLVFVAAVLWANDLFTTRLQANAGPVQFVYSMIKLVSQLTAIYGLLLIYKNVDPVISQKYKIKARFVLLQLAFILTSLQPLILGILAITGVIECTHLLHASDRAAIFGYAALIFEMFILSIFVTIVYRKEFSNNSAQTLIQTESLSHSEKLSQTYIPNGVDHDVQRNGHPYHWGIHSMVITKAPWHGGKEDSDQMLVMDQISVC